MRVRIRVKVKVRGRIGVRVGVRVGVRHAPGVVHLVPLVVRALHIGYVVTRPEAPPLVHHHCKEALGVFC